MSQTINDFRNFYAPNRAKELFSLADETQNILDFISFENIDIELNITKDTEVINHKNEYKQVLLNLLTNAKDMLVEREIALPKVIIEIDGLSIKVSDNAEGINGQNIQKIFDPYFTTKEGGLGIGLYMSKMIIEKNMGGKLDVVNGKNGAIFKIVLG